MVAVGDVVDAEVVNAEVFGIFCRYGSDNILVLIPETSWIASFCSCRQFAEPGDSIKIKIIHIDTGSGKIAATVKGVDPNPWETGQLDVGRKHLARVVRYVEKSDRCKDQPAYLIELLPGSFSMLCADDHLRLQRGDEVMVIIKSSDPFRHAVCVVAVGGGKP